MAGTLFGWGVNSNYKLGITLDSHGMGIKSYQGQSEV